MLLGPFGFICSRFSVMLFGAQGSPSPGSLLYLCESSFLIHHGGNHNLFVFP